jgi:membrane-associated protease RseP (regulator of RpoE activity)
MCAAKYDYIKETGEWVLVKPKNRYWLHILLFVITFFSVTIAGVTWAGKDLFDLNNFHYGLLYGVLILTFLSAHEFGHYFASRYHKVDCTLPFYIPMPLPFMINFGTFGAVIKTRTPIVSRKALFDIGVSGPLAGFVVSVVFLIIGLMTLPGKEFIYGIHPNYLTAFNGEIPKTNLFFGNNLLYMALAKVFANPQGFLPPMNEMYHYPWLNVGWFGCFVTTMNLLPFGQLDGGHVTYAMFGEKQGKVARVLWWVMLAIGVFAFLGPFYEFVKEPVWVVPIYILNVIFFPPLHWIKLNMPFLYDGWPGWLIWALITRFLVKIKHPEIYDRTPLDSRRMVIGWIAIVILIVCFTYNAIYIV